MLQLVSTDKDRNRGGRVQIMTMAKSNGIFMLNNWYNRATNIILANESFANLFQEAKVSKPYDIPFNFNTPLEVKDFLDGGKNKVNDQINLNRLILGTALNIGDVLNFEETHSTMMDEFIKNLARKFRLKLNGTQYSGVIDQINVLISFRKKSTDSMADKLNIGRSEISGVERGDLSLNDIYDELGITIDVEGNFEDTIRVYEHIFHYMEGIKASLQYTKTKHPNFKKEIGRIDNALRSFLNTQQIIPHRKGTTGEGYIETVRTVYNVNGFSVEIKFLNCGKENQTGLNSQFIYSAWDRIIDGYIPLVVNKDRKSKKATPEQLLIVSEGIVQKLPNSLKQSPELSGIHSISLEEYKEILLEDLIRDGYISRGYERKFGSIDDRITHGLALYYFRKTYKSHEKPSIFFKQPKKSA